MKFAHNEVRINAFLSFFFLAQVMGKPYHLASSEDSSNGRCSITDVTIVDRK